MSRKINTLLVALTILVLALSACQAQHIEQNVRVEVSAPQAPAAPAQDYTNLPPVSGEQADVITAPTAMPEVAAFTPIKWDDTCKKQSELVGVSMKPLKEGAFIACVYNGVAASVTIPAGTLADLDLGGIYVAKGPVKVDGVPNLTLRPARTGTDSEACAQVDALTAYGQTLAKPFKAQPYNFSCN
ncbi:hypothetical protein KBC75_04835 [Candidatus Shapirobacteria bacterium]|nr:hypothetical protein [Candidatus Shapirobacteria bacterium]